MASRPPRFSILFLKYLISFFSKATSSCLRHPLDSTSSNLKGIICSMFFCRPSSSGWFWWCPWFARIESLVFLIFGQPEHALHVTGNFFDFVRDELVDDVALEDFLNMAHVDDQEAADDVFLRVMLVVSSLADGKWILMQTSEIFFTCSSLTLAWACSPTSSKEFWNSRKKVASLQKLFSNKNNSDLSFLFFQVD